MKLSMICTNKGEKVELRSGQPMKIYYAEFGIKTEAVQSLQRYFGTFRIESVEPLNYKSMNEYTIMVSELITIHSGKVN